MLKQPQSKRSALAWPHRNSRPRLDYGCFSTALGRVAITGVTATNAVSISEFGFKVVDRAALRPDLPATRAQKSGLQGIARNVSYTRTDTAAIRRSATNSTRTSEV